MISLYPVDTGRKLNILGMFNLRPVSTGYCLKACKEEGRNFIQFNVYGLVKRPFRILRQPRDAGGKIVLRKRYFNF